MLCSHARYKPAAEPIWSCWITLTLNEPAYSLHLAATSLLLGPLALPPLGGVPKWIWKAAGGLLNCPSKPGSFQTSLSAGCVLHKNSESQKSRWWQGRSVTSGTTASPSTSCSLIISCEICEGHVVRDNLTKCFLLSGLQLFAVTWNLTYVGHE